MDPFEVPTDLEFKGLFRLNLVGRDPEFAPCDDSNVDVSSFG